LKEIAEKRSLMFVEEITGATSGTGTPTLPEHGFVLLNL
jgi:hypothetical protein